MAALTVGDVALFAFPFADLRLAKKRPVLIVACAEFNCYIICQITSKATSNNAISLQDSDFIHGGLKVNSYVRSDKLFTIDSSIIQAKLGTVTTAKREEVLSSLRSLFE